LIIGVVILIFIFGWVNTFIAELIWDFELEDDWKTLGIHGLELFVALLAVGIPSVIVTYLFPSLLADIVLFIVYIPIDGYVAYVIAKQFNRPPPPVVPYAQY